MAGEQNWVDVGAADKLATAPLRSVTAAGRPLAISFRDGRFGAVANACNHVGGPLGDGRLDGDYIVCPWHNWKFHRCSGVGEPGFEEDRVPSYPIKVEHGRVLVDVAAGTRRMRKPHVVGGWPAKLGSADLLSLAQQLAYAFEADLFRHIVQEQNPKRAFERRHFREIAFFRYGKLPVAYL